MNCVPRRLVRRSFLTDILFGEASAKTEALATAVNEDGSSSERRGVVFRPELLAAPTCPVEVLTKTEASAKGGPPRVVSCPAQLDSCEDWPVLHSSIERRRIVFRLEWSSWGHERSFCGLIWQSFPLSRVP